MSAPLRLEPLLLHDLRGREPFPALLDPLCRELGRVEPDVEPRDGRICRAVAPCVHAAPLSCGTLPFLGHVHGIPTPQLLDAARWVDEVPIGTVQHELQLRRRGIGAPCRLEQSHVHIAPQHRARGSRPFRTRQNHALVLHTALPRSGSRPSLCISNPWQRSLRRIAGCGGRRRRGSRRRLSLARCCRLRLGVNVAEIVAKLVVPRDLDPAPRSGSGPWRTGACTSALRRHDANVRTSVAWRPKNG